MGFFFVNDTALYATALYLLPLAWYDYKYRKIPKKLFWALGIVPIAFLPIIYHNAYVALAAAASGLILMAALFIMQRLLHANKFLAPADIAVMGITAAMLGGMLTGIAFCIEICIVEVAYTRNHKKLNSEGFPFVTGLFIPVIFAVIVLQIIVLFKAFAYP